jgi:hypothetical protein
VISCTRTDKVSLVKLSFLQQRKQLEKDSADQFCLQAALINTKAAAWKQLSRRHLGYAVLE